MTRPESQAGNPAKSRPAALLNARLDKGLLAYAAAATAAGVSLLALAPMAEAKIIYTKANTEIAPNKMLSLDLNHDGVSDFNFSNHIVTFTTTTHIPFIDQLKITPQGRNGVLRSAAVLRSGVQVGPKGKFRGGSQMMVAFRRFCTHTSTTFCSTSTKGSWNNITNGYLGLKFYIEGKVHYGWARLNVTVENQGENQGVYALLTGYAYETVANKPIVTGRTKGAAANDHRSLSEKMPEPATLGLLARGAAGLAAWRDRNVSGK